MLYDDDEKPGMFETVGQLLKFLGGIMMCLAFGGLLVAAMVLA